MGLMFLVPVGWHRIGHGSPPAQAGQDAPPHVVVGVPRLAEQVDERSVALELLEVGAQVLEGRQRLRLRW